MAAGVDAGSGSGAWRKLLQVAVSGAAIALIAMRVDLRESARVIATARLDYTLAAIVLYLVGQVMSAYRWRLIGTSVGLDESFAAYVRYYFIGMFFMFFGPSTLGGDLVRSLYLADSAGGRARAFNSVIFDRLNGLVVLVAIGAVAFVLFPEYDLPRPLFYATVAFGSAIFVAWWVAPTAVRALLAPDHRIRRFVEHDLGPFWRDRRMLVAVTLVSLAFHSCRSRRQYRRARAQPRRPLQIHLHLPPAGERAGGDSDHALRHRAARERISPVPRAHRRAAAERGRIRGAVVPGDRRQQPGRRSRVPRQRRAPAAVTWRALSPGGGVRYAASGEALSHAARALKPPRAAPRGALKR